MSQKLRKHIEPCGIYSDGFEMPLSRGMDALVDPHQASPSPHVWLYGLHLFSLVLNCLKVKHLEMRYPVSSGGL